jgi:hypothetical protein
MTDHWHGVEEWVGHHRCQRHNPHPAPTNENPERWECKCDPDAVWTAVWRILTPEQIRKKFAHLSRTRSDRLSDDLKDYIAEIQAGGAGRGPALAGRRRCGSPRGGEGSLTDLSSIAARASESKDSVGR